MPKTYSQQEREYIKRRLKEEAAACMSQYGIRRTTVDEIVRRVKIPKGSFYLFYKAKEELLFDVILEQHELINQQMLKALEGIDPASFTKDDVCDVIFGLFVSMGQLPFLNMLNSQEVELLIRKLPPETVAGHLEQDTDLVESLFTALPTKPGLDPKIFSAAFHALFFSTLHRDELGEDKYGEALRLLIYGLVTQMMD